MKNTEKHWPNAWTIYGNMRKEKPLNKQKIK